MSLLISNLLVAVSIIEDLTFLMILGSLHRERVVTHSAHLGVRGLV